ARGQQTRKRQSRRRRERPMRVTTATVSDGISERDFSLGDIPGVLWSPAGAAGPRPLILLGHGGGQHKPGPGLVNRARRLGARCGFAAASIDMPGSGDRPRPPSEDRFWDEVRTRRAGGEAVAEQVAQHFGEQAARAVPVWKAVLDELTGLEAAG